MISNLSVIIPSYNRAKWLPRSLLSVRKQTLSVNEIIVVDDGSTDETETLIKSDYPDIVYLRQNNKGVSTARNHGIDKATGEWLAFLDSDDEWLPNKLEMQKDALIAAPEIRICHTEEIWIRNGKQVNPMKKHAKTGGWIFQKCLPLCAMSPSSILIHRSVFETVGNFDQSLPACEDYDLWLRITHRYPVTFVEQPLIIKYGGHDDQLSRRYWGMDRFRIQSLRKLLDSGILGVENELAAKKMLVHKATIYLNGARKRNKHEEIEYYGSICSAYSTPPLDE